MAGGPGNDENMAPTSSYPIEGQAWGDDALEGKEDFHEVSGSCIIVVLVPPLAMDICTQALPSTYAWQGEGSTSDLSYQVIGLIHRWR